MNVYDIEDLRRVVAKEPLHQRCIDGDSTAHYVARLAVDLLAIELHWAKHPVVNLVDTPLVLVEFKLVLLHFQTFWQYLLGQSCWLPIDIGDLVLDNELALLAAKYARTNSILLFLRQDEVMLFKPVATDCLYHIVPSVVLLQQDAVGVE